MERFGGVPSEKQLEEMAFDTLRSGRVIPGYGHAVLRVTDPRYTGFHEFGKKYLPDDAVFSTVDRVFNVVPKVLAAYSEERVKAGKNPIANCWPNVDAISGSLLYHYGLTEFPYYTVLFSVSRTMGMLAQLILNRAMGTPITRPKSVSTKWVRDNAKASGGAKPKAKAKPKCTFRPDLQPDRYRFAGPLGRGPGCSLAFITPPIGIENVSIRFLGQAGARAPNRGG